MVASGFNAFSGAAEQGAAVERLQRWLERLISLKRQKVLDDPELFATYNRQERRERVVQAHVTS